MSVPTSFAILTTSGASAISSSAFEYLAAEDDEDDREYLRQLEEDEMEEMELEGAREERELEEVDIEEMERLRELVLEGKADSEEEAEEESDEDDDPENSSSVPHSAFTGFGSAAFGSTAFGSSAFGSTAFGSSTFGSTPFSANPFAGFLPTSSHFSSLTLNSGFGRIPSDYDEVEGSPQLESRFRSSRRERASSKKTVEKAKDEKSKEMEEFEVEDEDEPKLSAKEILAERLHAVVKEAVAEVYGISIPRRRGPGYPAEAA